MSTSLFDVEDVQYALASLKFGKAAGHDGLIKESLLLSSCDFSSLKITV